MVRTSAVLLLLALSLEACARPSGQARPALTKENEVVTVATSSLDEPPEVHASPPATQPSQPTAAEPTPPVPSTKGSVDAGAGATKKTRSPMKDAPESIATAPAPLPEQDPHTVAPRTVSVLELCRYAREKLEQRRRVYLRFTLASSGRRGLERLLSKMPAGSYGDLGEEEESPYKSMWVNRVGLSIVCSSRDINLQAVPNW